MQQELPPETRKASYLEKESFTIKAQAQRKLLIAPHREIPRRKITQHAASDLVE